MACAQQWQRQQRLGRGHGHPSRRPCSCGACHSDAAQRPAAARAAGGRPDARLGLGAAYLGLDPAAAVERLLRVEVAEPLVVVTVGVAVGLGVILGVGCIGSVVPVNLPNN